jgi:hypothetical protein
MAFILPRAAFTPALLNTAATAADVGPFLRGWQVEPVRASEDSGRVREAPSSFSH